MQNIDTRNTRKEKQKRKLLIAGFISMVLGVSSWAFYGVHVLAADNFINVTTIVDEDINPGTGCSLYEAVVAATTHTAYGGCSAGSIGDRNIINIPAGTYTRDVDGGPNSALIYRDDMMLQATNVSFQGAGIGQTIIDAYSFELLGDDVAFIDGVSVTTNAGIGRPAYIILAGSNKTVSSVEMGNGSMAPAEISFMTESGQVLTNSAIKDTNITATPSTNPAVTIACAGSGACEDISFENVNVSSRFSTQVQLNEVPGVSITDSIFGVDSCANSTISLGEDAHVDGLEQSSCLSGDGGYVELTVESADIVRNVTHTTGANSTVRLIVNAPIVDGYVVDSGSLSTFFNEYIGSTVSNIDINAKSPAITSFGDLTNLKVTSQEDGYIMLNNTYDGAQVSDVAFEYFGDTNTQQVTLNGDNMVVEGFSVTATAGTEGIGGGFLNVIGDGAQLSNLNLESMVVGVSTDGDFLADNFTIDGPSGYSGLHIAGGGYDAIVRNGYIHSGRDALSASSGAGSGAKLLVENVKIEDIGASGDSGPGAVYISGVDYVTVRDVTIDQEVQSFGAPIYINDGLSHLIANTTISDSSRGIYVSSSNPGSEAMAVRVNNVTVNNDADSALHQRSDEPSSLIVESTAGRAVVATVQNSVFAGSSPYTPCVTTTDTTVNVSNSFAQDPSCGALGFTESTNFGFSSMLLADNNTQRPAVGYDGLGGYVQTIGLQEESILVGAGSSLTCEATDARGVIRSADLGCDVGAFQLRAPLDTEGGTGDSGGDGDESGSGSDGGNTSGEGASGSEDDSASATSGEQLLSQLPPNTGEEPTSSNDKTQANAEDDSSLANENTGSGVGDDDSEGSDATFWIVAGTAAGIIGAATFALSARARAGREV